MGRICVRSVILTVWIQSLVWLTPSTDRRSNLGALVPRRSFLEIIRLSRCSSIGNALASCSWYNLYYGLFINFASNMFGVFGLAVRAVPLNFDIFALHIRIRSRQIVCASFAASLACCIALTYMPACFITKAFCIYSFVSNWYCYIFPDPGQSGVLNSFFRFMLYIHPSR